MCGSWCPRQPFLPNCKLASSSCCREPVSRIVFTLFDHRRSLWAAYGELSRDATLEADLAPRASHPAAETPLPHIPWDGLGRGIQAVSWQVARLGPHASQLSTSNRQHEPIVPTPDQSATSVILFKTGCGRYGWLQLSFFPGWIHTSGSLSVRCLFSMNPVGGH